MSGPLSIKRYSESKSGDKKESPAPAKLAKPEAPSETATGPDGVPTKKKRSKKEAK